MLLNHHRNLSQMMVEKGTGTSPGYQKKRAGVGTPNIFNTWNLKLAGAHLQ
jgi:hypothetical protein